MLLCVDMLSVSPSTSRDQTQRDAGINHDMSCVPHEPSQNSTNQMCQQMLTRGLHCVHNVWTFCWRWTQRKMSLNVELWANKSFETGSSRRSTSPVLWTLHLTFHWHISNTSPTFENFHFHEHMCVELGFSFTNRLDIVWVELTTINIIVSTIVLML